MASLNVARLSGSLPSRFGDTIQPVAIDGVTAIGEPFLGVFDPVGIAGLELYAAQETSARLVDQSSPTLQVLPEVATGLDADDLLAIGAAVYRVVHVHRADAGGLCLIELEEY